MAITEANQNKIQEIQRLIGRNVIVFQHIETALKQIHILKNSKGTINDLQKRTRIIKKLALGDLVSGRVISKFDTLTDVPNPTEVVFSINMQGFDDSLNETKKFLRSLIPNRNMLVHTFTSQWDLNDEVQIDQARDWLIAQYDDAMKQRQILLNIFNHMENGLKEHLDFLNSEEFEQAFNDTQN